MYEVTMSATGGGTRPFHLPDCFNVQLKEHTDTLDQNLSLFLLMNLVVSGKVRRQLVLFEGLSSVFKSLIIMEKPQTSDKTQHKGNLLLS